MANGEILGVTLLMEDLLLAKEVKESTIKARESISSGENGNNQNESTSKLQNPNDQTKRKSSSNQEEKDPAKVVLKKPSEKLLDNYNNWHFFLISWKRLEMVKSEWARRRMGVGSVNNADLFARYW